MNDKIDNLITQLKTEIEDYIQAEIAARSKDVVSFPNTVSEASSISLPDFSAPTNEIGSPESSIGGKPMGESGIEAAPVEVSVPPMPTPTSLVDSSDNFYNSQRANNSDEQGLFARSGNPVTNVETNLPIPVPDFSLPMDNTQLQSDNLNISSSPAPVSEADFQMPAFVNSGTTTNSSSFDAFNAPVTDLPLPGSNNLSSSTNDVSIDEALSNLPNFNNFSDNQGPQNDSSSSITQNEPTLPPPFAPNEIASSVPADMPTYDISEVTPQGLSLNGTVAQTDTTSPVLPESNFSAPNASANSTDSGFSKAKGLLSRVLQKEWGKK